MPEPRLSALDRRIVAFVAEGHSYASTAEQLRVSVDHVFKVCVTAGVREAPRRVSEEKTPPRTSRSPRRFRAAEARRQEVVAFVKEGHTAPEAAAKFGLSSAYVQHICRNAGVRPVSLPARRRQQVIERTAAGEDPAAVAASVGLSPAYVKQIARSAGVVARQKRGSVGTTRVLAELLNTGDTYQQIADRLGTSKQWVGVVAKNAREAGIKMPHRKGGI